jgi:hypothetical protein
MQEDNEELFDILESLFKKPESKEFQTRVNWEGRLNNIPLQLCAGIL